MSALVRLTQVALLGLVVGLLWQANHHLTTLTHHVALTQSHLLQIESLLTTQQQTLISVSKEPR